VKPSFEEFLAQIPARASPKSPGHSTLFYLIDSSLLLFPCCLFLPLDDGTILNVPCPYLVHRLEGKCGHQAVIHQPEGGQPHVDFVVDNKIECYGGLQGIKKESSKQAFWPSKFSCDQLMCESRSDSNHGVTCGKTKCEKECDGMTKKREPKVLDLSEIDFDGKEWNKDSAGDDTLLGLMSLGDKTSV